MNTIETRIMHELRDDLVSAVAVLISPGSMTQRDDDGGYLGIHIGAPLLDQLIEATGNGIEKGAGGSSAFGSKPTLCIAAWDLYTEIDQSWRTPGHTLVDSLRMLPAQAAVYSQVTDMSALVIGVQSIVNAIRELLNPPRRLSIAARCPACSTAVVLRPDTTGELVQRAALTLDATTGCTCLACQRVWPPSELESLARALGCSPIP
jgi:hypothetical protein